jgi:hypothetical protein
LALEANVPVGLGFIDYRRKQLGIERWVMLTGDEQEDLAMFRAYYADKTAFDPQKAGEIRFRERRSAR